MSFRTRSHVCAREECAGIAPYTRGDGGERCWTRLSHLLPVQLVLGCGGSRSGSPRSRSSQEPVLPSCLPGISVTALMQAYILSEVSPEASSIFFALVTMPKLAQIYKAAHICLLHCDKSVVLSWKVNYILIYLPAYGY